MNFLQLLVKVVLFVLQVQQEFPTYQLVVLRFVSMLHGELCVPTTGEMKMQVFFVVN